MSHRTIIREHPEVVRGPRGLSLRILGETYSPRPGTVSYRALEDAALDSQLEAVSNKNIVVDGRAVRVKTYAMRDSIIVVDAEAAFYVDGDGYVGLHVEMAIADQRLDIRFVTFSAYRPRETPTTPSFARVTRNLDFDDIAVDLALVLDMIIGYLAKNVPEVAARAPKPTATLPAAHAALARFR